MSVATVIVVMMVVSKTLNNLDMMLPLQDVVDCNFKLQSVFVQKSSPLYRK